jgi:hypothetical protein
MTAIQRRREQQANQQTIRYAPVDNRGDSSDGIFGMGLLASFTLSQKSLQ